MTSLGLRSGIGPAVSPRSLVAGLLAAAGLLALYLGVITIAQGPQHAIEQLALDAPFVGLILAGFGTQVGLLFELRAVDRRLRAGTTVVAAGTGASAVAMLACCAHHLVDVLPLVGLSAAAVFLDAYKTPLLLIGIGMNLIGIVVIARQLRRARRALAFLGPAPAGGRCTRSRRRRVLRARLVRLLSPRSPTAKHEAAR